MGLLQPERLGLHDCIDHPVMLCGKAFRAHKSGALYWPAEKALIVSDLHLEKASSYAPTGQLLPPYDTRATLMKLADVIDAYNPDTVIALGDSLHDGGATRRMHKEDFEILRMLQEDREWIWITGNHDPVIGPELSGHVLAAITVEGLTLRHEPRTGTITHEIAGHMHPTARLVIHGTSLRRPCFVGNGLRLIIPAFGALTGGLNILGSAFDPLFNADGLSVWMLGQEGLYPVAPRLLRDD